ncbi:MAG: hypothetical protein Q8Q69_06450 [Nitrosopumilaceae archaeon]|nr:hypothetical protein [Nitrosopumilaceae archaeon]
MTICKSGRFSKRAKNPLFDYDDSSEDSETEYISKTTFLECMED